MPNLKKHINSGIFTYPAYVFAFMFLSRALGRELFPNVYTVALGYFVYVIGSDLPDIDSDTAPMHHFLKVMMTILGTFAVLDWSNSWLTGDFGRILYYPAIFSAFILGASAVSYLIITLVLKLRIFRHRGFAHSLTFALIYGAVLYFAFYKNSNLNLYVPVAGIFGVMLHMFMDYRKQPQKIFKLW